ncbi:hypothetical protein VTO73DRAFT_3667 [Trametes versicolor]
MSQASALTGEKVCVQQASVPRSAGHIAQPPVFVGPRSGFAPCAFLIPDSPREERRALEACLNKSAIGHAPIGRPARQEPFHGPGRLQQPFARRRTQPLPLPSTSPANALTSRPARAAPRYSWALHVPHENPAPGGGRLRAAHAGFCSQGFAALRRGGKPGRARGNAWRRSLHPNRMRVACSPTGERRRGPVPLRTRAQKVLVRRTEMKETPRRGYCTQAV